MFAQPIVIQTEVFARLPDRYRAPGRSSSWLEGRQYDTLHSFLEGPAFDRAGTLYCTDIPYGRVFRVSPDGEFDLVVEYDGEPNGLKIHQDGRLFVADHKRGILEIDTASREVKPVVERAFGEGFRGPNDLHFARNGDLYFTDQGQSGHQAPNGSVYALRAKGGLVRIMDGIPSPNGLVLSLDERILYVNVTRANAVWRLPLMGDNRVTKVGTFLQLSGGSGPDGLAIDEEGGLVVAHPGLGAVWRFSREGELTHRVVSCAGKKTTNIAFGGAGNQTLFITESETGSILSARMPVPGTRMFSHS